MKKLCLKSSAYACYWSLGGTFFPVLPVLDEDIEAMTPFLRAKVQIRHYSDVCKPKFTDSGNKYTFKQYYYNSLNLIRRSLSTFYLSPNCISGSLKI